MRTAFAWEVFSRLLTNSSIAKTDSVLAVCAGESEMDLFSQLGFSRVCLSGLDPVLEKSSALFECKIADVRSLPFQDGEFEFVFVSDGLHHCDSPHRALVEMYRVARKGVIVMESRDSLAMRIAMRLNLADRYELRAVLANDGMRGGVNYTSIPNFVYRWTEREFEKTICTVDPTGFPGFQYFYGFNQPSRDYHGVKLLLFKVSMLFISSISRLFKRQSNSFCMVATKPASLFPWLESYEGKVRFKK
jgi:SAM-dependent methyltransferase